MTNRYSSDNAARHFGVLFLPIPAIALTLAIYDPETRFEITHMHYVLLWLVGIIAMYAMIIVHELGHFLAARLVGIEITRVTIGAWRKVVEFSAGGAAITLRTVPSGGSVVPQLSAEKHLDAGLVFFLLAGVGAEVVVAGWAWLIPGPALLWSAGDLAWAFLRIEVVSLAGSDLLRNLIPGRVQMGGDAVANDGRQILDLWRTRHQRPEQQAVMAEALEIDALSKNGRFHEALEKARISADRHPENTRWLQVVAQLHSHCGQHAEAEAAYRDFLSRPGTSLSQKAEVLDMLCCQVIFYRRMDLLPEADGWSGEALWYAPGAITLKGTRGSVLVELGRNAEGKELLLEVEKRSECGVDRAISSAYLAKICAVEGKSEEAAAWMKKAVALGPEHVVVKRIAGELEGYSTSSVGASA